jgi:formate hydrogenlyase transcriptional activator
MPEVPSTSLEAPCPQRYEALLAVSQVISLHRDLSALLDDLAQYLHPVVDFDFIKVDLYDVDKQVMRLHVLETPHASSTRPGFEASVEESPGGWAWRTQQPVVVPRVDQERRFPALIEILRQDGVKSCCALPLTTSLRRVGALVFGRLEEYAYGDCDLQFLQQVANQVAVAVDNALNYQDAQSARQELVQERDRLQLLLGVNNAVFTILDIHQLLGAIAANLQHVFHHEYCSLSLYEPEQNRLRVFALDFPKSKGWIQEGIVSPVDDSPDGIAFTTRKPFLLNASEYERHHSEFVCRLIAEDIQSCCTLPLTSRHRILGTLNVGSRQESAFTPREIDFLTQIANQIAMALDNALAFSRIDELNDKLAGEKLYLEEEIKTAYNFDELVGDSQSLKRVLKQVEQVAPTASTVLIRGETGTGKELIARALHQLSPRRERTFVKMNCAAIPTGLLESELFGHEKGAFTGAIARKIGRFELAHQGTLFLDEIGDVPLDLQSKLLRVLQEEEFERLGSTRTIKIDVRVITATNRDLERMVEQGQFRSDLYYRINVFPIVVPPLRERAEDIPQLVRYFVQKYARLMNKKIDTIPTSVLDALSRYNWPGNVRELENLIERAMILTQGSALQVPIAELKLGHEVIEIPKMNGAVTLVEAEREHILRVLREMDWVIGGHGGAAARLGMKRTTLLSKMQRLGISRSA